MDARPDTLSDKFCQVNTRIGRIARWQAIIGGFTMASSLSLEASEDESDDGSGSDDVGLPSDNDMSTWHTYPFVTRDKKGSSFEMRVVILIEGGLV